MLTEAERERLRDYFTRGFRELQLADIKHSDEHDVRMGTFTQCAAFIDALALAFTAGQGLKPGDTWSAFMEHYFPAKYAPLRPMYHGFRNLLLHNFSAAEGLAFTHGDTSRHLKREGGRLVLNRGSFVAATERAFEKFAEDVENDDALAARALKWLDGRRPIVYWIGDGDSAGKAATQPRSIDLLPPDAGTSASFAMSATSLSAIAPPDGGGTVWKPAPDMPRAVPPRKKRKKPKH